MKQTLKVILVLAALGVAFWLGMKFAGKPAAPEQAADAHAEHSNQIWTCSMHPQIRQPKPGKCPICGMDLILASSGGAALGPRQFATSPEAIKLMEIETRPVERRAVEHTLRLVGKVQVDERKLAYLTAWVPGRIEKLYVNFTGAAVKEGDPMIDLYSPELVSAQQELIQALRTASELGSSLGESGRSVAQVTVDAARERLRLWGLRDEQIAEIEKRGEPTQSVTFYAPVGGVVISREGQLGMYVQTGTRLFSIADLSTVWVELDAYESDLQWARVGEKAIVTAEALPGESFEGEVEFIDPVLAGMTRTANVRLSVPNEEGKLKPEMFVRAQVMSSPSGDGSGLPLVIPASAPLITGTRAVVYVKLPDTEMPTFEGREIALGPRMGDYYIVNDGLSEGELVVTRGNFKIDSSLQIEGKPSMMQPEGGAGVTGHAQHGEMQPAPAEEPSVSISSPAEFRAQFSAFVDGYYSVSEALAGDNFEGARKVSADARKLLDQVNMGLLSHGPHMAWMASLGEITQALDRISKAENIELVRAEFETLSNAVISAAKTFGLDKDAYVAHCPMAFNNRGANWLQPDEAIRNPYFGGAMLACGEIIETVKTAGTAGEIHQK